MKPIHFLNDRAEQISHTSLKRELNSLSDTCVGGFLSGTRKQQVKSWSYNLKVMGCKLYLYEPSF